MDDDEEELTDRTDPPAVNIHQTPRFTLEWAPLRQWFKCYTYKRVDLWTFGAGASQVVPSGLHFWFTFYKSSVHAYFMPRREKRGNWYD